MLYTVFQRSVDTLIILLCTCTSWLAIMLLFLSGVIVVVLVYNVKGVCHIIVVR